MKSTLIILALAIVSCGRGSSSRDIENYGADARMGGAPFSKSSQHQGGWARKECLLCHNTLNIHRGPNFPADPEALLSAIRSNGGSSYCITCHSGNGVN